MRLGNPRISSFNGLLLPSAPQFEKRASGYILMDTGAGFVETAATLQCKHCGIHWIVIKGSGRKRGFCLHCYGATCGSPACEPCVPFEKKVELYEKGLLGVLR